MFDYPSVTEAAKYIHALLAAHLPAHEAAFVAAPAMLAAQPSSRDDAPLVRVAIAGRLPQPAQPEHAASLQASSPGLGADAITVLPSSRWDVDGIAVDRKVCGAAEAIWKFGLAAIRVEILAWQPHACCAVGQPPATRSWSQHCKWLLSGRGW